MDMWYKTNNKTNNNTMLSSVESKSGKVGMKGLSGIKF